MLEEIKEKQYLGFDWSTQKLKAIVLNDNLEILQEAEVLYDTDLPEYRTSGGVLKREKKEVFAPPLMWVKALDLVLDRLTIAGADFSKIVALSGGAQQHGSVWWAKGYENILNNLDSARFLYDQMAMAFSLLETPIWMDSSTTQWCKKIEEAVGGTTQLAHITGSRAYERHTGPQIAKIFDNKPRVYETTERISLVSSFGASLFIGKIAPIDWSDGSGMNLLDIHTKKWNQACLEAAGDQSLGEKLGEPVFSDECIGSIAPYFVDRFGFDPSCKVIAFTGDNPSSVAGLRLSHGWITVSLGTSDTVLLWLDDPHTVENGQILCNPVDPDAYCALICFSNGSLTRESVRNELADRSWDKFNEMLESTPRGNFGNMGLYFNSPEIVPRGVGAGKYLFSKTGPVNKLQPESEVRALLEGQFIARRVHAEDIGFVIDKDTKILATGGASVNKHLLQVLSDVFNAPVYTQDCSHSVLLGAAYRARHGLLLHENNSEKPSFFETTINAPTPTLICNPYSDANEIYKPMLKRYREYVANLIAENDKR